MHRDLSGLGLQDRNHDGVIDYLDARIYVPGDPTPAELAAAANVAARLAFETQSMDLPIGFPISAYEPSGSAAIAVGRAVAGLADPRVIAMPDVEEAEKSARSIGVETYRDAPGPFSADRPPAILSLAALFAPHSPPVGKIILGPDVRSTRVIDLAARVALESAELQLPLVTVAPGGASTEIPGNTILVGMSNPYVQQLIAEGKVSLQLEPGTGRVEIAGSTIVVAGGDAAGEDEALKHVAQRLPYLWEYGKGCRSLSSIEDEIRRTAVAGNAQAAVVFEDTYVLPWEVDDARRRVQAVLLESVTPGAAVDLELRLSEPLEVRQSLAAQLREMLQGCGAGPERSAVRVLCAHKQGYSWIDEELKPQLNGAARIRILFRELERETDALDCAERWLQELYPIDEVLARDLGIPVENVVFEKVPSNAAHVYEVFAEDAAGRTLLHAVFDPQAVRRPLFDIFPGYAHALVATGWLRASVDGIPFADERIKTDYERFWDEYQSEALAKIHDYVLRRYDGMSRPAQGPHFGELIVEVELSEPDFKIGIDEERISTLEALHEDIYFETLLFFDLLGTSTCGKPLTYPGRIIPIIGPSREGPGLVRVRFSGLTEEDTRQASFGDKPPRITAVNVGAGCPGVMSVEVSTDARFSWLLSETTMLPAIRRTPAPEPIVQWKEPIGPYECTGILASLACFPSVRPFLAGSSWLGQPVWAIDVIAPVDGQYLSQAKACAAKPCLFITGRQHANEVSSTSHILKLVELLATDPEHRKLLDRVNFIIHPMANPDGAALVDELHEIAPGFMLHAGYLGALGMDITSRQWSDVPLYPEARVRADLWRMWRPDVVLNPHGYPSHEWVQLFAGYSAWVRSKEAVFRDWWIPRGWFMPRFDYIDDERFPQHREAAFALRDRIAAAIDKTLGPINERMYRRYAKYTGTAPELHDGVWICQRESTPDPQSFGFMTRHPEITFFEGLSEVPDEVAADEWLETVAAAGLEFSLVHARFLANLPLQVERTRWEEGEQLYLRLSRKRL